MKLSAGVLAALASVGDAAITCPDGPAPQGSTTAVPRNLFEVDCSAADGFKIRINEGCRKSTFTMVDFANSFVWKAATPIKMNTFTGSNWEAVNGVSADECKTTGTSPTDISPKPLASGQQDSEGTNAFGWNIPFSCATATENAADNLSNNAKFLTYDLYWNSQFTDGTDGTSANENIMYQLGQVKISCRINPYQEDAGVVTITEDAAVEDIADKYVDVAAGLELKVKKVAFESNTPVNEAALSAATIATGATGLTYTDATSATIGDYMELSLENAASSSVLSSFAVSITKCWASNDEKKATDRATDSKYYADTNTAAAAGGFVFFDNFCPKYPDWVGPNPVTDPSDPTKQTGYLKETWSKATSLHKVHFRQFGFQSKQAEYASTTSTDNKIYYHCFVKICDKNSEQSCSLKQLDGTTDSTCSATAYTAPAARRRRRSVNESQAAGVDAPQIELGIVENCEATENCFTYAKRTDDESTEAPAATTKDSSAMAATSALAAVSLALFH